MDFLWAIFEVTITILESFLITYFICSSLGHNFSTKKGIIIFLAGGIAESIIVLIINHLTFYEGVLGVIYVAAHFIYSLLFLKGSILKKLFISVLTEVCLLCINALVTGLLSMVFGDDLSIIYTQQTVSRFLAILMVQALLVYLFSVILKITLRNTRMKTAISGNTGAHFYPLSFCLHSRKQTMHTRQSAIRLSS